MKKIKDVLIVVLIFGIAMIVGVIILSFLINTMLLGVLATPFRLFHKVR